jgi:hypothetical protein
MASLDELVVTIKADAAGFKSELTKATAAVQSSSNAMSSNLNRLSGAFKGLIPLVAGIGFSNLVFSAIQAGDALDEMATKTGVSVETLSSLQLYAKQNGVEIGNLANAFRFMNNNLIDTPKAFEQIGISIKDFQNLSTIEQFTQIADKVAGLGTVSQRTKVLMDIFGRSGADLAPLFNQGAEGIRNAIAEAERLGLVITSEDTERMADFADKWDTAGAVIQRVAQGAFVTAYNIINDINNSIERLKGNLTSLGNAELGSKKLDLTERLKKEQANLDNLATKQPSFADGILFTSLEAQTETAISRVAELKTQLHEVNSALKEINPPAAENTIVATKFTPEVKGDKSANNKQKELDNAKKSLDEYNLSLERQYKIQSLTPQQQEGMAVYYRTLDLAQKAGIKNAEQLADKNRLVAESNYAIAEAQYEAARRAEEMRTALSDGLASAIIDFNNASDAAKNFAKQIAKTIIQRSITDPLSTALIGNGQGGSGLLSSILPSFAVGAYNLPSDMIAQVHKGEMIIPASQANQIRGGNGANGVTVVQNFQISNDVPSLITAHIKDAAPRIAKAAHDAVFSSIQRGGSASQVVGIR